MEHEQGEAMPLKGHHKIRFDEATGHAKDHLSWVERSLSSPGGDWNGEHGQEVEFRTAAAAAWAELAQAYALGGGA